MDPMDPMDPAVVAWRRAQRALLLARRQAAPAADRLAWSRQLSRLLHTQVPVQAGDVVALYWPFRGEYDPRFIARHWRLAGARTALPEVVAPRAPLQFRAWWPGVPTRPGVYGLPVPVGTELLQPSLLLIPPVGFDAACHRLGYGGGYYDRTLAALPAAARRIGVGFELSRIDSIRPQPHDQPMDLIVTEAGVWPRPAPAPG